MMAPVPKMIMSVKGLWALFQAPRMITLAAVITTDSLNTALLNN